MPETMTYEPGSETATGHGVSAGAANTSATLPLDQPRAFPVMIPRCQVGYWTMLWRASDAEARNALQAGDYETFDSDDPTDAVRWLLSDDD